jgi:hypothetical protein
MGIKEEVLLYYYSMVLETAKFWQNSRHSQYWYLEGDAAQDGGVIDIRNYRPKRIQQLMWSEFIKKMWEVDPLLRPQCTGEMRIISFIYKRTVIKKILSHLNVYGEKKIGCFALVKLEEDLWKC